MNATILINQTEGKNNLMVVLQLVDDLIYFNINQIKTEKHNNCHKMMNGEWNQIEYPI